MSSRGSILSEEAKLRQSVGRTTASNDVEQKRAQRKASLRAADDLSDVVPKEKPARARRPTASVRPSVILAQPAVSGLNCAEERRSSSRASARCVSRLAGGCVASASVMLPGSSRNDGFDGFGSQLPPEPTAPLPPEPPPETVQQPPPTSSRLGKKIAVLGKRAPKAANPKPALNLRRGTSAANPLEQCTLSLSSTQSRAQKPARGTSGASAGKQSAAMAGSLGGRQLGVSPLDL